MSCIHGYSFLNDNIKQTSFGKNNYYTDEYPM